MALSVVDLYSKILPKTNCRDCGFPTCLAFAGMVVSQKHPLENCPHIPDNVLEDAKKELEQQYKEGKWLQKDMAQEALEWAKEKSASMSLEDIALRIGGRLVDDPKEPSIILPCFNRELIITKDRVVDTDGRTLGKNDQTFVYIHMAQGGFKKPTGIMKSFKEFPNTVSKIVSMTDHVEAPLRKTFSGKKELLEKACSRIKGTNVTGDFDSGDLAFQFMAFPKVPVILIFWDAQEGFEPEIKLLFDETIIEHLDIEAIMFLSEHLVALLKEAAQ